MDQPRFALRASLGQPLHRHGVHHEGLRFLALAEVDVMEGRAVEDECRADGLEGRRHSSVVRDVELLSGPDMQLASPVEQPRQIGSQRTRRRR